MNQVLATAEIKADDGIINSVFKALLYYDVFQHALTLDELRLHCSEKIDSSEDLRECLDYLVAQQLVFHLDGYYSLQNDPALVEKRKRGSSEAQNAWRITRRRAVWMSRFPYVRGVFVSGSLSKNYFDKNSDADFFIVTQPNRLWLCRTLLILFKKAFLLNSKKYWCVNYLIDSDHLEIPDRNLFTATEMITLKPVINQPLYELFQDSNKWVSEFYPNQIIQDGALPKNPPGAFAKFFEKVFSGKAGEWLEDYFHKLTLNRWKNKFNSLNSAEFELQFRSTRSASKHHPQGFQFKMLREFEEKCKEFELQHQIKIT